MDEAPATAWTKIARAADPTSPESRKSLHELVLLYDKPLRLLFEAIAGGDTGLAEDLKQDFVISHLLSGKVFQAARPVGRFRTFLAVAVRNYIINWRESEGAKKRRPASGAKPFSQFGAKSDEPLDPADSDPDQGIPYEQILTRARAWDIYREALQEVRHWCSTQPKASDLKPAVEALESSNVGMFHAGSGSTPARQVVEEFKRCLRRRIREEIVVHAGEDERGILGREIAIFLDALEKE